MLSNEIRVALGWRRQLYRRPVCLFCDAVLGRLLGSHALSLESARDDRLGPA